MTLRRRSAKGGRARAMVRSYVHDCVRVRAYVRVIYPPRVYEPELGRGLDS